LFEIFDMGLILSHIGNCWLQWYGNQEVKL